MGARGDPGTGETRGEASPKHKEFGIRWKCAFEWEGMGTLCAWEAGHGCDTDVLLVWVSALWCPPGPSATWGQRHLHPSPACAINFQVLLFTKCHQHTVSVSWECIGSRSVTGSPGLSHTRPPRWFVCALPAQCHSGLEAEPCPGPSLQGLRVTQGPPAVGQSTSLSHAQCCGQSLASLPL